MDRKFWRKQTWNNKSARCSYIRNGKGICEQEDIALILAGGQKYTKDQFKDIYKELLGE